MKLLKSLCVVLCLMVTLTHGQTVDPTAASSLQSTGNILNLGGGLPWNNTVTGAAGGASGGATPAYNPTTGNIIFGYMTQTVSQSVAINQALANAGTGIQIAGYKYSWDINNDLNNGGGNRGTLTGNVSLTNTAGNVLESYNYNYSQTNTGNAFKNFSGTQMFTNQYQLSTVDRLTVSFTGKDQNFWAGYYGPRVHVNDVSLLYTVAPPPPIPTDFSRWIKLTDENGEFTLTKAGVVRYGADGSYIYQNLQPGTYSCSNSAWGKDPISGVYKKCDLGSNTTTTTLPKTNTTDFNSGMLDPVTSTSTTGPTSTVIEPITIVIDVPTTTVTSNTSSQPTAVSSVVSAPEPAASSTSTTTSSNSSSSQKESSNLNTSLALSVINKNQERDSSALSVAQTAMSQAADAAQQAQQEAAGIASNAAANSQTANVISMNGQQSLGNGVRLTNTINNSSNIMNSFSVTPGAVTISALSPQVQSSVFTTPITTSVVVEQPQTSPVTIFSNNNSSSPTVQNYAIVPPNFLTDKTNPLTEIIEGRQSITPTNNVSTTGSSVNKNASDNDAAGGVSIDRMAQAPKGYGDYLNFTLRDVAFYAPKEVYRNQRNVDNIKALRQLSSDRLHRDMVEQQYRR
jgi:hypothetical protein